MNRNEYENRLKVLGNSIKLITFGSMDMNRYLFVVFSMFTACASTVPNTNYEELVDDMQRFAAWYADHSDGIEDCYDLPLLVPTKNTTDVAEIHVTESLSLPLIKVLPKFPKPNINLACLNEPLCIKLPKITYIETFQYQTIYLAGANNIRAPGLV